MDCGPTAQKSFAEVRVRQACFVWVLLFSNTATVQVDKTPEVQVEEQSLGSLPDVVTVRPFSVNIYSHPVQ